MSFFFNQTPSLYNKILEQEKNKKINTQFSFPSSIGSPKAHSPVPTACYSPGLVLPRAWHPLEAAPGRPTPLRGLGLLRLLR